MPNRPRVGADIPGSDSTPYLSPAHFLLRWAQRSVIALSHGRFFQFMPEMGG